MFQSQPHLHRITLAGGNTEDINEFKCPAVIEWHLCHKAIGEISALLDLPSAIIMKWKRLGATTAQARSNSLCKLTERGPRVL